LQSVLLFTDLRDGRVWGNPSYGSKGMAQGCPEPLAGRVLAQRRTTRSKNVTTLEHQSKGPVRIQAEKENE